MLRPRLRVGYQHFRLHENQVENPGTHRVAVQLRKRKNCAVTTGRFPELAIVRVSLVSGQSLPRRRGNVRELQNYIERAVVLAQATELEPCLLPTTITGDHVESIAAPAGFPPARE